MTSFIDVSEQSPFPLENLPYGVFFRSRHSEPHIGVRLGNRVVDLTELEKAGVLGVQGQPFQTGALNAFMGMGKETWATVRERLQDILSEGGDPVLRSDDALLKRAVLGLEDVTMQLPARIGDYTDFYSSRQHATNVGTMFRGKENALKPNWLHLPVGYHGRASSVVVSGTPVRRPKGQLKPDDGPPTFGPSRLLDIELELGFFVGSGSDLGEPISIEDADDHIFGFVLVNDWSARDIQKWEYVPLGPFLGKSFATSISPWVVPYAALEPFRVDGEPQSGENPEPLPYLRQKEPRSIDIDLSVHLQSASMREAEHTPETVARSNARYLYWSPEQQLAHHTVNGCNTRPGDLMASGTISGETPDSYGSFLELTWRGERPISLPDGAQRTFLQDGDNVVLRGVAKRSDLQIGFGEVGGTILPASEN